MNTMTHAAVRKLLETKDTALANHVANLDLQRDDLLEALKQLEAEASFATIPIDVERKALNIALSNARAAITKAES